MRWTAAPLLGLIGITFCILSSESSNAQTDAGLHKKCTAAIEGSVVVRPGETLQEIADRYDTSSKRLIELNNLPSSGDLWAGSRIQVPLGRVNTSNKPEHKRISLQHYDECIASGSKTTYDKEDSNQKQMPASSPPNSASSDGKRQNLLDANRENIQPYESGSKEYPFKGEQLIETDRIPAPQTGHTGCPEGMGMVTKKEGGFFGIGAKTVEVGCMTPYQYEMLNQMDRMNRPKVIVPPNTRTNCRTRVIGNQAFTSCY